MGSNTSAQSRSPSSQSRNANHAGQNNLPPLLFHTVHGDNVGLSRDCSIARRTDSFCKGIAFTNRPVKVNERVYLRFVETSSSWSGALRFGFTGTDPNHLRSSLPKYACPDLTNKQGNWAKALSERLAQRDALLYYYVNESGQVYYGINGEDKGIFFDGVNVNTQLWGMVDIYGNTMAIELANDRNAQNTDSRQQLNNRHSSTDPSNVERLVLRLSSLNIDQLDSEIPLKYYGAAQFLPLPFHRVKGTNVFLSSNGCIAERSDSHYCQGYTFTSRPLRLEERLVIQVLKTERSYVGAMTFGLTTCDPTIISPEDLPDDADNLIDRPEYWVLKKDVAESPQKGDELTFVVNQSGEVQFGKNGQPLKTIMHVDQTQMLWAFFDLYGNTLKIKAIGVTSQSPAQPRLQRSHTTDASSSSILQDSSPIDGNNDSGSSECTLCFERPINCVLYSCGHMCMCYQCAQIQWKTHRGGFCPICRKNIQDVVRIYRT